MTHPRYSIALAACSVFLLGGMLLAHPDDPKGLVKRVPYVGPAYRTSGPSVEDDSLKALAGLGMEFPHEGVQLQAWLPLGEMGEPYSGNDCWGYVSPTGREYALMGLQTGTSFVDITDPGDPQVLGKIDGSRSTWRDIKVYGDHAYIVTEGFGGGIQVVDLSDIDAGVVALVNTVLEDTPDLQLATTSSHNVVIDETSGYLYRAGGGNNGLRIYSLADPQSPSFVGLWPDRYVHDAQVVTYTDGPWAGREIAFCCSGFNGGGVETGLDILDVTDKSNIVNVSRLLYSNGRYSHQAWLSEDRTYLYLNDEADETGLGFNTTTKVFDVSDLANPVELTSFANNSSAIGHNLYTLGNLIFEANYRSGVRVFDAADPANPVEIAYFDTWPADDLPNFNSLWSVYPYYPSGTFIGSDMEKGLFVFRLGFDDCNNNGIPDDEEVASDPSLDCNLNGLPDDCDIADGSSPDENQDGVPDECLDCNGNGQSDLIDIASGATTDCDANGVPDECEPDCNLNGVPDSCEINMFAVTSDRITPVEAGAVLEFTIPSARPALEAVNFALEVRGDLTHPNNTISVFLNGFQLGTLFNDNSEACGDEPLIVNLTLLPALYNLFVNTNPTGAAHFEFHVSGGVDPTLCPDSYLTVSLSYLTESMNDDNGNGIPDECDPPVCQGEDATVWVDLFGNVVGGHFDGLPYFGILLGTQGDDVIVGTDGPDVIIGLSGDDVICGGDGDDRINGNNGDDSIDAGDGFDRVHGNGGHDTCVNGERVSSCEGGSKRYTSSRR